MYVTELKKLFMFALSQLTAALCPSSLSSDGEVILLLMPPAAMAAPPLLAPARTTAPAPARARPAHHTSVHRITDHPLDPSHRQLLHPRSVTLDDRGHADPYPQATG